MQKIVNFKGKIAIFWLFLYNDLYLKNNLIINLE